MQDPAMQAFLENIPNTFRPEAAGNLDITAVLDLGDACWTLCIKAGTCTLEEGDNPAPDLRLRAHEKDLLRLFKRELNPLLAYTTGKLRLEGDVQLALQLVKLFDLP